MGFKYQKYVTYFKLLNVIFTKNRHQQFKQSKTGKIYAKTNYFQFPLSINIFILSIMVLYTKEYDNI